MKWQGYIEKKKILVKERPDEFDKHLYYYYADGINYYEKMKNDYYDLRATILINLYELSVKSDVFLICLLKDHHN